MSLVIDTKFSEWYSLTPQFWLLLGILVERISGIFCWSDGKFSLSCLWHSKSSRFRVESLQNLDRTICSMNFYLMKKLNLTKISLLIFAVLVSGCNTIFFIGHKERTALEYVQREDSLLKNLGIYSKERVRSPFFEHNEIYRFYTSSFPTFSRCFVVTPNEEVFPVIDHDSFNRLIEYENISIKESHDAFELAKFYLNIIFPYCACAEYVILNELSDIPGFSEKDLEKESEYLFRLWENDSLLEEIERKKDIYIYKPEKFPWLPEEKKCQNMLKEMDTLKDRFHPPVIKQEENCFLLKFYTWMSVLGKIKYYSFKICPDGKLSEEYCGLEAILIGACHFLQ